MGLKDDILRKIKKNPVGFRELLEDPDLKEALNSIGVLPNILELHAPSERARKKDGLGQTLCGMRGTRHRVVTCKRCKKLLAKS